MPKEQIVIVTLGHPSDQNEPMPAAVALWPTRRKMRGQYLSEEQRREMGDDTSALWLAVDADELWWLKAKLSPEAQAKLREAAE